MSKRKKIVAARRPRVTPWKAMAVFGFLGGLFSHPHWLGAVEGAGLALSLFFLAKAVHTFFVEEG